jgi:hypothetical protein
VRQVSARLLVVVPMLTTLSGAAFSGSNEASDPVVPPWEYDTSERDMPKAVQARIAGRERAELRRARAAARTRCPEPQDAFRPSFRAS